MAIEGGDRSQKAPTIPSSAPPEAESSPAPEPSTLALALAQPSAAPQEHAAGISALVPNDDVHEDAAGGGMDYALGAAGGSQSRRRVRASLSESGPEIQGLLVAPQHQQASRFDPAGFRPSGGALRVASRGMQYSSIMPGFQAGPSSAAHRAPTGSPRVPAFEPPEVFVIGEGAELSGAAPRRRNIGVIGDGRPSAQGPAASGAADQMSMVPWRQRAPPLLLEPAPPTMLAKGPGLLRPSLDRTGLLGRQPLRLEMAIEQARRMVMAMGPGLVQSPHRLELARQQSVGHHLALTPTRPDDSAVLISREDVRRGWAELQARSRECKELKRHNADLAGELGKQTQRAHALELECWHLRQALLNLHQTPHSSSRVAGERRSGVCGDCSGPAQVQLTPCSHIALCSGPAQVQLTPCSHIALCYECYLRRQKCPWCGARISFQPRSSFF